MEASTALCPARSRSVQIRAGRPGARARACAAGPAGSARPRGAPSPLGLRRAVPSAWNAVPSPPFRPPSAPVQTGCAAFLRGPSCAPPRRQRLPALFLWVSAALTGSALCCLPVPLVAGVPKTQGDTSDTVCSFSLDVDLTPYLSLCAPGLAGSPI